MISELKHQEFASPDRVSQSLSNDRCQNILYKAVFEHFAQLHHIAALLLSSKSFQNSSFGANFLLNFRVDANSILLFESVLSPSSCFSLQFVPSLNIKQAWMHWGIVDCGFTDFVREIVESKYLLLSLRSLTLAYVTHEVLSNFFGDSSNSWPHLHDLKLEACGVNDDMLEIISKKAMQLRTVDFSENSGITDSGLEHLSNLASLTSLDVAYCNKITDAGIAHLSKLSCINVLNLSFCNKITGASLEHLTKLDSITSLHLGGCYQIVDEAFQHLHNLGSITALNLRFCNQISDACLQHISKLASLTSLDLDCCNKITDVGMEHISKLVRITSLDLAGCALVTDVGLECLSHLVCINSLNLFHCKKITSEAKQKFQTEKSKCRIIEA